MKSGTAKPLTPLLSIGAAKILANHKARFRAFQRPKIRRRVANDPGADSILPHLVTHRPNGQKVFLTATLEDLKRDEKWFSKATDAIGEYWRNKNIRKSANSIENQRQSVDA